MDTSKLPKPYKVTPLAPTHPSFRTEMNARRSRQLFYEFWCLLPVADRIPSPVFTLHEDRPGLINLGAAYVQLGDPTGYKLSKQYLESYDHFQFFMKSSWFREAKEVWDRELDAKLSSEGLDTIREYAKGEEGVPVSTALAAAKFLANKAYKDKGSPRGRPSKEEVAGNLKQETENASAFADDAARIKLVR